MPYAKKPVSDPLRILFKKSHWCKAHLKASASASTRSRTQLHGCDGDADMLFWFTLWKLNLTISDGSFSSHRQHDMSTYMTTLRSSLSCLRACAVFSLHFLPASAEYFLAQWIELRPATDFSESVQACRLSDVCLIRAGHLYVVLVGSHTTMFANTIDSYPLSQIVQWQGNEWRWRCRYGGGSWCSIFWMCINIHSRRWGMMRISTNKNPKNIHFYTCLAISGHLVVWRCHDH